MKNLISKLALAAALIALSLALPFYTNSQAFAQEDDGPPPPADARPGDRPPPQNEGDLIRRLNLTPEQIKQIREIRQQSGEEFRQNRQRLMRAQLALDEAIYADEVNEADVEARARDLATAQASVARLRALTELRIRRVLTGEQLNLLRQMRQEARERDREQRQRQRPGRDDPNAFEQRRRQNLPGAPGVNPKPGLMQPPPAGRIRRP
jgi:protein CpxP